MNPIKIVAKQVEENLKSRLFYHNFIQPNLRRFHELYKALLLMQHAPRAGSPHSLSNKETQMEFLSAFNTCYFTNQRRKSRLSFKAVDLLAAHHSSTSNILSLAAVPQSACVNSI
jgi:hypothetical protein